MTSMPNRTTGRSLHAAQLLVLAALVVALGLGWYVNREIPPDGLPLEQLPVFVGRWALTEETVDLTSYEGCKTLLRYYQSMRGESLDVRVQGTYSRLGGLRDWSLAAAASGWTVTNQKTVEWSDPHTGFTFRPRLQTLVNGPERRLALTWYASASREAPSLQRAELLAALQRLTGSSAPWAGLYVLTETTTDPSQEATMEAALQSFSLQLASALRRLLHPEAASLSEVARPEDNSRGR